MGCLQCPQRGVSLSFDERQFFWNKKDGGGEVSVERWALSTEWDTVDNCQLNIDYWQFIVGTRINIFFIDVEISLPSSRLINDGSARMGSNNKYCSTRMGSVTKPKHKYYKALPKTGVCHSERSEAEWRIQLFISISRLFIPSRLIHETGLDSEWHYVSS